MTDPQFIHQFDKIIDVLAIFGLKMERLFGVIIQELNHGLQNQFIIANQ
jgi:hypothetical protein